MIIQGKEYKPHEIEQVFNLCAELIQINEDQNARLIAFDAKLKNEEAKVRRLTATLMMLTNGGIQGPSGPYPPRGIRDYN